MSWNRGLTRSKISSRPPTIRVSVPAFAPTSPPDTGEFDIEAAKFLNPAREIPGREWRNRTHVDDDLAARQRPFATPFSPNNTFLDVGRVRNHDEDDVGMFGYVTRGSRRRPRPSDHHRCGTPLRVLR